MPSSLLAIILPFFLLFGYTTAQDPDHKHHAIIGILVDLHEAVADVNGSIIVKIDCGPLNVRAFQQLAAVRWATEIINTKSWSTEFTLDFVVHDTCGDRGVALTETNQLIKWSDENIATPLIGVIVVGSRNNERVIDEPLKALNHENISAIVTSSRAAELLLSNHGNVFTTAPDISSVVEPIVSLIAHLETDSVAVISSCTHAIRRFEKFATAKTVPAKYFSILQKDNMLISDEVIKFFKGEAGSAQTVVLLLETFELGRLIEDERNLMELRKLGQEKSWILGSVGMDQEVAKEWSLKFNSSLFIVQPHAAENPDFKMFFLEGIKEALRSGPTLESQEYVEKIYNCQWQINNETVGTLPPCKTLSTSLLSEKYHQDSDVGFIVNAVSTYSAALRLAQLETCKDEMDCDHVKLPGAVMDALRKLNFPVEATEEIPSGSQSVTESTVAGSHELEGTRGRINHLGKLVGRRYDIFLTGPNNNIIIVGQYSSEEGLSVDTKVDLSNWRRKDRESTSSNVPRRQGKTTKMSSSDTPNSVQDILENTDMRRVAMAAPEFYISRVWAMVVLAIGITGVFLAMYMLVYVLLKMCDGTLYGNQVMGILLLLCIMVLFASVVLFVLPPGPLLCHLRIFLPALALSVCFGILLLKAMQLRSLISLGLGGRVSAVNQFVTLIFIVAVQLAVSLQWFLTNHETETLEPDLINDCFHPHRTYLFLHSYIGILILFVFFYAMSVLKIRRNYNEARWVTIASLMSLPVALGWAAVVFIGPVEFQEPAASITFITIATVVLFSIFIPKLGTISRQTQMVKRKQILQQAGPGYAGSISTIFTTLSDRGHGSLQSQKRGYHFTPPKPPPMPSMPTTNGKSVTYSPRLATNIFHSPSNVTSLTRSVSMKAPLFDTTRGAYP